MVQRRLHTAKLPHQLHAPLVANPRRSRNVVNRISPQRHHVNHALWRHAQYFLHLRRIQHQVVFRRIQNKYAVSYKLHHVLVIRHDVHRMPRRLRLLGQRPNHVVRFIPLVRQDRNMERLQRPPDIRELLRQIFRHRRPVRLVPRVVHVFKLLRLDVELLHRRQALRLLIAQQRRI